MADKAVVTQTTLDAIGQAIIDKGGATEAMTPAQMPAAILAIPSGGGRTGHRVTVNYLYGGGSSVSYEMIFMIFADGTFKITNHLARGIAYDSGTTVVYENVVAIKYCIHDGSGIEKSEGYNFDGGRIDLSNNHVLTVGGFSTPKSGLCKVFDDDFVILENDITLNVYMGCFLRGTLVTLADRTEKPIEDVTCEDELLVWDFDNGCYASAKPAWIKRREESLYYFRNRYASGRELLTTGRSETGWGHRHYDMTRNEFRYTPTTVGDAVFTLDGADEHRSCEKVAGTCEFYNIITERHFNLFANGILTSCSLSNFRPMKDMKFVDDGSVRSLPFSVFRSFVPCEDETKVRRYYDALRIGEMSADGVAKLGEYVGKLIAKEAV